MGYTVAVGETRALLDADDAPLATAGVTDPDGHNPPFATAIATVKDQAGFLVCSGSNVGTQTFDLMRGGTTASHEVTVEAAPFDWSLGDPV